MYWSKRFYLYSALTRWMPDCGLFMPIKRGLLRAVGVKCAPTVEISSRVRFLGSGQIVLEDGVRLLADVQIGGRGRITVHKNVLISEGNIIRANGTIEIGAGTEIYQSNILMANGQSALRIGANCQIAHGVSLKTSTHDISPNSVCVAGNERFDDITISDGCWLCAGSIVIPGVRVGRMNVIAAGAVVTRDTRDYSLMAGVPAECKKSYEV